MPDQRGLDRRHLLWSVVLLGVGCAAAPVTAEPTTGGGFPRTVVDSAGDQVRIPTAPTRIVVATEYNAFDSLLALDVPPFAATRRFPVDWPWAAAAGATTVRRIVERPTGPDLEEIAALAPDLLFLQLADGSDEVAARMRGIAPTVRYNADDARGCLRVVADAVGAPERADPVIAALDARIATARDRIGAAGRAGWTFVTFTVTPGDTVGFFGAGTDAYILLSDMGLRPAPLLTGTVGYGSLSPEQLSRLDADVVIGRNFEEGSGPAFERFEVAPLFRAVPAVARGRYRRLSVRDSYAIGQSSVLSWTAAVDVLEELVLDLPT